MPVTEQAVAPFHELRPRCSPIGALLLTAHTVLLVLRRVNGCRRIGGEANLLVQAPETRPP